MRRVFAIDVLSCHCCPGPMKILAQIHPNEATRKILECLGWSTRPPPIMPAHFDLQKALPIVFEPSTTANDTAVCPIEVTDRQV